MTPQESDELDRIITGIKHYLLVPLDPKKSEVEKILTPAEAKAALNQLLLKARRSELQQVESTSENHLATTGVSIREQYIQQRIAELDREIET